MSDEITVDYTTGLTLYFHRFLSNGNVFLTDAATNEVYGTGASDADTYDAPMVEEAAGSAHYKGSFASGGTAIASGVYQVCVKIQTGGSPADSPTDVPIFRGEIYWNGTAEINLHTLTGADGDTLETLSDQIDDVIEDTEEIIANTGKVVNVYPAGETKVITGGSTVGFVEDEKL